MHRRQAGQSVLLGVSTGTTAPDDVPTARVYTVAGVSAAGPFSLPPLGDPDDNLFGLDWLITIAAGEYVVRYSWAESTAPKAGCPERLTVLPGGDASGPYANLCFYEPPHARFVVGQREDDTDEFRRNPRV